MKQNTKSLLFFSIMLLFIISVGVIDWIINDSHFIFGFLGIIIILVIIGYALGKWSRDFKKIIEKLPADHKIVTDSIAAIDIGNFRFIYRVYEKGNKLNPANKTYLSMEVGIPFPSGNSVDDEQSLKESIKSDLQGIIDRLQEEGLLTLFNHIVKDSKECNNEEKDDEEPITWTGQPFGLEFQLKKVTPSFLIELQKKIVDLIEKYNLQNYSWYVCNYNSLGKEYRYHKGNLLQSAVLVKHDFDKLYLNYKQFYSKWYQEVDTSVSDEEYKELYSAASKNRDNNTLLHKEMYQRTKTMFKDNKKINVKIINDAPDDFSVTITVFSVGASTFHIIKSGSLWWLSSEGRLSNIYPISFDNESSACGLLLTILQELKSEK